MNTRQYEGGKYIEEKERLPFEQYSSAENTRIFRPVFFVQLDDDS